VGGALMANGETSAAGRARLEDVARIPSEAEIELSQVRTSERQG
jgi:hypothetical protein